MYDNPGWVSRDSPAQARIIPPKILTASSSRTLNCIPGWYALLSEWSLSLPYLCSRSQSLETSALPSSCSAPNCHLWQLPYRMSLHTHECMLMSCFLELQCDKMIQDGTNQRQVCSHISGYPQRVQGCCYYTNLDMLWKQVDQLTNSYHFEFHENFRRYLSRSVERSWHLLCIKNWTDALQILFHHISTIQ